MLSYAFLLALLAPSALVAAETQIYRKCDGGLTEAIQVRVEGCNEPPCSVVRGYGANIQVDFSSEIATTNLRLEAHVVALGGLIDYTLPSLLPNACDYLIVGTCPLLPGQDATLSFSLPDTIVDEPIPATIILTCFDEHDQIVFCAKIDLNVRPN